MQWRRWGLRLGPDGIELTDHRWRRRLAVLDAEAHWGVLPSDEQISLRLDPELVVELEELRDPSIFVAPRLEVGD